MGYEKRSLLLIGAGGHAAVVLDALLSRDANAKVKVFAEAAKTNDLLGKPIHLGMPNPTDFPTRDWAVHVAIGNNKTRAMLCQKFQDLGYSLATICHASAVVSPFASIASGSVVCPGAIINARAHVGHGVIINSNSVVEHDCFVGDWAHISPSAVMAGDSKVGALSWVGAGAVLREGSVVGDHIIVGANALVRTALLTPGTYVGTPAKLLKKE